MNKLILSFLLFVSSLTLGQSFAPAPGNAGSTAIAADSSIIIDWASAVTVTRGPMNILNPSAGLASFGVDSDAIGVSTGSSVVSLGDGGEAVITFDDAITNGVGPDFAIFENGFADDYLELAFVEVSSDGTNYFRFDGVSETPAVTQTTNFSYTDCRYVHNLAGKYRSGFGTPFDLEELSGIPGLNINHITHVKIIDVIGSIDPAVGTFDSNGNIINDPFPTEFESSGFDLDAVAVIHSEPLSLSEYQAIKVKLFPNPSNGVFTLIAQQELDYLIFDSQGREVLSGAINGTEKVNMINFESGFYTIHLYAINGVKTMKFTIQ